MLAFLCCTDTHKNQFKSQWVSGGSGSATKIPPNCRAGLCLSVTLPPTHTSSPGQRSRVQHRQTYFCTSQAPCRTDLPNLLGMWAISSRQKGASSSTWPLSTGWSLCWPWPGCEWTLDLHYCYRGGKRGRFPSCRIPSAKLNYCSMVRGRRGEFLSHCLAESNCSSDYVKK